MIVTTLLIFISTLLLACDCIKPKLIEHINSADFIATVVIHAIRPDNSVSGYATIEFELITLYKGKYRKDLQLYSLATSDCAFSADKGTKWLIFARFNTTGHLCFDVCDFPEQLDRKMDIIHYPNAQRNYDRSLELEINFLNYLKEKSLHPKNVYQINSRFNENTMQKFRGIDPPKERFAIYKIWINQNLTVKKIKAIKEFSNKHLSEALLTYITDNIKLTQIDRLAKIPKETEICIALFFYPAEDGYPSFISEY
jgi:hypothetical protein